MASEAVQDMILRIMQGEAAEATEILDDVMLGMIGDRIEEYRPAVAATFFGVQYDETEEPTEEDE